MLTLERLLRGVIPDIGDLWSSPFEVSPGDDWSSVTGDGVGYTTDEAQSGARCSYMTLAGGESDYGSCVFASRDTYHIRWFFKPKNIVMADGDLFSIIQPHVVGNAHYMMIRRSGGNLQMYCYVWDGAWKALLIWTTICAYQADAWQQVDWFMDGSQGAGSNIGRIRLNKGSPSELTNLQSLEAASGCDFGGRTGVDAGTSGDLYVDSVDVWSIEHDPTV